MKTQADEQVSQAKAIFYAVIGFSFGSITVGYLLFKLLNFTLYVLSVAGVV